MESVIRRDGQEVVGTTGSCEGEASREFAGALCWSGSSQAGKDGNKQRGDAESLHVGSGCEDVMRGRDDLAFGMKSCDGGGRYV